MLGALPGAGPAIAGVAVGTYASAESIQEVLAQRALSRTDLDRAKSLSAEDPSLLWVAVDVIAVGVDVAAAAKAFARLAPFAKLAVRSNDQASLRSLEQAGDAITPGLGHTLAEDAEQIRSGGRAGTKGFCSEQPAEIENLRLTLLTRTADVGRVQRALQAAGIRASRRQIAVVKRYLFDSPGIAFSEENYLAWRRLATGNGTIDDARFMVHELAELKELERIRSQTGFDFLGKGFDEMPTGEREGWRARFNHSYLRAHSAALDAEFAFVAAEVGRVTGTKPSRFAVALADAERCDEALDHLRVDGTEMPRHPGFRAWIDTVNRLHPNSRAGRRRLIVGNDLSLIETVERVKQLRLNGP